MATMESRRVDIAGLLREKEPVYMCAPMVRYSKLPFRKLVRKYGCHIAHTPMIMSESFVKSDKARDIDFTTDPTDRPLVVQFAANDTEYFSKAAQLVAPYVDGVDLNCGCPQRWAISDHYGAYLITKPQLVQDLVMAVKRTCDIPVSIKIRIHDDLKWTVELVRRAEQAGVSWITVHGRTIRQRTEPANMDAIKLLKDSVRVPVIANGDIRTLEEVELVVQRTGANGVMAARGILNNPAMFNGSLCTPLDCVQDWVDMSLRCGVTFTMFHHHLMYMLERGMPKNMRGVFNTLKSTPAVLDFLRQYYNIN